MNAVDRALISAVAFLVVVLLLGRLAIRRRLVNRVLRYFNSKESVLQGQVPRRPKVIGFSVRQGLLEAEVFVAVRFTEGNEQGNTMPEIKRRMESAKERMAFEVGDQATADQVIYWTFRSSSSGGEDIVELEHFVEDV